MPDRNNSAPILKIDSCHTIVMVRHKPPGLKNRKANHIPSNLNSISSKNGKGIATILHLISALWHYTVWIAYSQIDDVTKRLTKEPIDGP